ncbi:YcaO-like family protein [Halovivax cerinus]|uniref:YcaO-like family protein n=1 Tax=Halovivax cerinus TaxID=1487865 RepID=A0ABD5NTW9_9EURY|nr:YcaO-like family protein [Halovivax cerinus]
MDVPVVGDDPIREEVAAALTDVDVGVTDATADELADVPLAVVGGIAGAEVFATANRSARQGNTPWIAVEVGGVGGHPISSIDAAVAAFGPDTACFECLRARVRSTRDEPTSSKPRGARANARLAGAVAGRECVRLLTDGGDDLRGSVLELPHARRVVLPVPGCDCQESPRNRSIDPADDDERSLEETVDAMDRAIDDRVGIVRSIGEIDSYPIPYYLATLATTSPYSDATAPTNAAGVDEDWNRAFVKAIGEGLERYCAGVYRESDFVAAPAADLDRVLEPTDIVRPDDAASFDPTASTLWIDGVELSSGERTHLPADAIHFPQPGPGHVPQITTGLGLGSSVADALFAGLTEVVERDATMLSWYSTFEPRELDVADDRFDRIARRVESEGLTVTPLVVTQDVDVPVVTVALHRTDGEWPAFAVGSAADLNAVDAAQSALAEATQNWMELRSIGREESADAGAWIGTYASFPDPARAFVDTSESVAATDLGPGEDLDAQMAVETVVDRLVEADLTPYAGRITTRDVEKLGLEAVRVVVPTAQPLFTDEPYFGDRAEAVPRALGFEPLLDREPHPYP